MIEKFKTLLSGGIEDITLAINLANNWAEDKHLLSQV